MCLTDDGENTPHLIGRTYMELFELYLSETIFLGSEAVSGAGIPNTAKNSRLRGILPEALRKFFSRRRFIAIYSHKRLFFNENISVRNPLELDAAAHIVALFGLRQVCGVEKLLCR